MGRFRINLDNDLQKARWSWICYELASSPFSTTVASALLGPYLTSLVKQEACDQYSDCTWCSGAGSCFDTLSYNLTANGCPVTCGNENDWCCSHPGAVNSAGMQLSYNAYFTFVVAISVAVQIVYLPIVGAIADLSLHPLRFLFASCTFGSLCTLLLFLLDRPSRWWVGGLLFVLANVAYGTYSTFYNMFLSVLFPRSKRYTWSSRSSAVGFLGGGLTLIIDVILLQGKNVGLSIRIGFLIVGVWWVVFASIPYHAIRKFPLKHDIKEGDEFIYTYKPRNKNENVVVAGWKQFTSGFKLLYRIPNTLLFLISALIYNDGIQTLGTVTALFAQQALRMAESQLFILLLMNSWLGFIGANLTIPIKRYFSPKWGIIVTNLIICALVIGVYFCTTANGFFGICAIGSICFGANLSLSRGQFSRLIPSSNATQLFGLYQVSQRGTSFFGPLLYSAIVSINNNNPRPAALSILLFFGLGSILLFFVDVKKGEAAAREYNSELIAMQETSPKVSSDGLIQNDADLIAQSTNVTSAESTIDEVNSNNNNNNNSNSNNDNNNNNNNSDSETNSASQSEQKETEEV